MLSCKSDCKTHLQKIMLNKERGLAFFRWRKSHILMHSFLMKIQAVICFFTWRKSCILMLSFLMKIQAVILVHMIFLHDSVSSGQSWQSFPMFQSSELSPWVLDKAFLHVTIWWGIFGCIRTCLNDNFCKWKARRVTKLHMFFKTPYVQGI